jgi:hypothetical protein
MTPDEDDDRDLLRAWRDAPHATPGDFIDRRVLKAAEAQRRRRALPLAVAMAACLLLALYSLRTPLLGPSAPAAAPLDTSTFGLYEGRDAAPGPQARLQDAPVNTGFSPP